ncbi:hypothetical protein BJV78DRAFT_1157692 [Lactifluus subvellereus]|nr:hypothetical protein BJV78DRAFT_1157692 [Lactifluus subvellereus]
MDFQLVIAIPRRRTRRRLERSNSRAQDTALRPLFLSLAWPTFNHVIRTWLRDRLSPGPCVRVRAVSKGQRPVAKSQFYDRKHGPSPYGRGSILNGCADVSGLHGWFSAARLVSRLLLWVLDCPCPWWTKSPSTSDICFLSTLALVPLPSVLACSAASGNLNAVFIWLIAPLTSQVFATTEIGTLQSRRKRIEGERDGCYIKQSSLPPFSLFGANYCVPLPALNDSLPQALSQTLGCLLLIFQDVINLINIVQHLALSVSGSNSICCDTLFSHACFAQEVSFAWLLGLASRLDRVVDNYTSCIDCDALAASSSLPWFTADMVSRQVVWQGKDVHPMVYTCDDFLIDSVRRQQQLQQPLLWPHQPSLVHDDMGRGTGERGERSALRQDSRRVHDDDEDRFESSDGFGGHNGHGNDFRIGEGTECDNGDGSRKGSVKGPPGWMGLGRNQEFGDI